MDLSITCKFISTWKLVRVYPIFKSGNWQIKYIIIIIIVVGGGVIIIIIKCIIIIVIIVVVIIIVIIIIIIGYETEHLKEINNGVVLMLCREIWYFFPFYKIVLHFVILKQRAK